MLTLELQRVPFAPLVDSALRLLRPEADARGVALSADVDASAEADLAPDKIERVLFNLLTNALRHTPSDGSVAVRVERREATCCSASRTPAKGSTARRRRGCSSASGATDRARSDNGAGLGLAIARGLVEAHGGAIWAENRTQGGACISFTIPT